MNRSNNQGNRGNLNKRNFGKNFRRNQGRPRYNRRNQGQGQGQGQMRSGPTGWCTPTVIYLMLGVLGIIFSGFTGRYERAPLLMLGEVIHTIFWTALLYWFCSIGYSGISWFILLIPIILIFLLIVFEANILSALGHEEKSKEVHIKRTYQVYY